MRFARPAFLLLALAAPAVARADEPFYLKDGDRVVFYGDSITDQRLYTVFTEAYVVTRFPNLKVDFVHSGWGGDRVTGGGGGPIDVRLDRDVIAYKPTVVTIMLGMNDASYRAFDQKIYDTYTKGYRHIVERLKSELPGVRLTLIRPSPYDDVTRPPGFPGGYNEVLVRYGDFVEALAKETGSTVADLNGPVVDATRRALAADPSLAPKLNPDRIHPDKSGQLLMAAALLKAWHAPALVSEVVIDAGGDASPARLVEAKKSKVEKVESGDGKITWTETDAALPLPINLADAATKLALRSSSVVDDLDREVLKVTNLPKPRYTLEIDGKAVGDFDREALTAGVNLATETTPMLRQAAAVMAATVKHNELHYARWREVQVPFAKGDTVESARKAMEGLDGIESAIVARRREAARPASHRFALVPKG
ncbi:MAG TPA: SGNH/GDSL hydrolase family protein [Isosphaeraceae bacterium]|jgi:lysophospholipase L1-like esterase